MSERRKPSTRYKGERQPKRRQSSTPPPTPSKSKRPSIQVELESEEEEEEASLPVRITEGAAIPTSHESQKSNLPLSQYQTIPESGVLNAALVASRQKWLSEGIFEKFWTKPTKKKNGEDSQNPARDSMNKLPGECFMIIEPHSFKITLFSVKNPQVTFLPPVGQSPFSGATHGASYGSPYQVPIQPTPPPRAHSGGHAYQSPSVIPPYQSPAERPAGGGPTQKHTTSNPSYHHGEVPEHGHGQFQGPHQSQGTTARSQTQNHDRSQSQQQDQQQARQPQIPRRPSLVNERSRPQIPDSTPNTDPVIQMLAARAATDHELKALMKVVAQGHASQEQLGVFQKHIDELNGIIQAHKRQAAASGALVPSPSLQKPLSPPRTTNTNPPPPLMHPPAPQSTHYTPPQNPRPPPIKQEPFPRYYQTPLPTIKPKAPVPVKQNISAVVFEFAEATGVRYLIPKNSILEYLPGHMQVLVSFLMVRKGDAAASGRYNASKEYYQPMTIRIVAENSKALEPLSRVVAPPDKVRKYFTETMDNLNLAEKACLVMRLPRAEEDLSKVPPEPPYVAPDVPMAQYEPPNSLLPLHFVSTAS